MMEEKKVPLTQDAYDRLQEKLVFLEGEDRKRIINDIAVARAHGDLSENAEYHAAKERQRFVESRISMLSRRVSDIQLMNLDRIPHGKVGFGSTVHLKDEGGQTIV